MGTEVLRPQDCLIERIRGPPAVFNNRRRAYNGSPSPNIYSNPVRFYRKPAVRSDRSEQKRRSQAEQPLSVSKRPSSADELRTATTGSNNYGNTNASRSNVNIVMEKVTILRRGQSLDSQIKSNEAASKKENGDMVVTGTERLGPGPEKVPKHTWIVDLMSPLARNGDVYAGSAFAMSPSPSSLPLPSFSKKQLAVDDSATRDLRRLLRLD